MNRWFNHLKPEMKYILRLFVLSRFMLFAVIYITLALYQKRFLLINALAAFNHLFASWDAVWYLIIARDGYSMRLYMSLPGEYTFAFFPLYPVLIKLFALMFRNYILAGMVISNLTFFGALIILYKLLRLDFDDGVSKRTLKYLILLPAAYFFTSVYTESLFLFLSLLALYRARQGRWWESGLYAFLAALTRPVGICLIIPLVLFYFQEKKWDIRTISPNVLSLLGIPTGFFSYMAYLYLFTGNPLAFFSTEQQGWGHHITFPLMVMYNNFFYPLEYKVLAIGIIVALCCILLYWKEMGTPYIFYALALLLFGPTNGNLISTFRYMIIIFPLPLALALFASEKKRDILLTLFLVLSQLTMTYFWVLHQHVVLTI